MTKTTRTLAPGRRALSAPPLSGTITAKSPSDIDKAVGERVRALRVSRGLSQETLGQALGVTFQQVQKYEKGTNRITTGRLHLVAAFLESSIAELAGGLGGTSTGNVEDGHVRKFLAEKDSRELMECWLGISPDIRRYLVRFLKSVADTGGDAPADANRAAATI